MQSAFKSFSLPPAHNIIYLLHVRASYSQADLCVKYLGYPNLLHSRLVEVEVELES